MISRPYFERIPAQDLLADKKGEKYDYLAATKGKDYVFIYTCNGSTINVNQEKLNWNWLKASWFNPRNGTLTKIGTYKAKATKAFDPPGEKVNGNDWVLILDHI